MSASHFERGDIVSCGYSHGVTIIGKVVELRRRSDGAPFLMVEITSHPNPARMGQREYPDRGWILGVGDKEGTCERCHRAYRFSSVDTDRLPGTCASCARMDSGHLADPSRRSSSWERKTRSSRLKDAS